MEIIVIELIKVSGIGVVFIVEVYVYVIIQEIVIGNICLGVIVQFYSCCFILDIVMLCNKFSFVFYLNRVLYVIVFMNMGIFQFQGIVFYYNMSIWFYE